MLITLNKLREFLFKALVPDWVSGNAYALLAKVLYGNVVYECTTANSDVAFTAAHWQIIVQNDEPFLTQCILEAQAEFEGMTNRKLAYATYTDYLNGDNSDRIYLKEWPINEVTALKYYDGSAYVDVLQVPDTIGDSTDVEGAGLLIFTKDYAFSGKLQITYTAGYSDIDLWQSGRAYVANDLVSYNGSYYKCDTPNSDAVFTIAKWEAYTLVAETTPYDIAKAIKYLAAKQWYESPAGNAWFMKSAENIGSQVATSFQVKDIMPEIEKTAERHRKWNI